MRTLSQAMATAAAIAAITASLASQQTSFEVASVRPNKSGPPVARMGRAAGPGSQIQPLGGQIILRPGGRFSATNATLAELIRSAYGVEPSQIVGGPRWMESERFDITANAGADATSDQVRLMLRALLVERFRLATHSEQRVVPVYWLIADNNSPRPGARLRRSGAECAPMTPSLQPRSADAPGPPPPPPPPLQRPGAAGVSLVGASATLRCPSMFVLGDISAREITLDELAQRMSPLVKRPVVNRTGLAGTFDVDLAWAADPLTARNDARPSSLFSAIQEQLGLRLESRTAPIDVLVIDRAEAPTPN